MNSSFNYSGFIEIFLNSSDDYEPYGCVDEVDPRADRRASQFNPVQHRESLNIDSLDD